MFWQCSWHCQRETEVPWKSIALHHLLSILSPVIAIPRDVRSHGGGGLHHGVGLCSTFSNTVPSTRSVVVLPEMLKEFMHHNSFPQYFREGYEFVPSLAIKLVMIHSSCSASNLDNSSAWIISGSENMIVGKMIGGNHSIVVIQRITPWGITSLSSMLIGDLWTWRGSLGRLRLGVVVLALVHDLSYLPVKWPLHLLLYRASGMCALVVASRVLTSFYLLLSIFSPVVAVIRRPICRLLVPRIKLAGRHWLGRIICLVRFRLWSWCWILRSAVWCFYLVKNLIEVSLFEISRVELISKEIAPFDS